MSDEPFSLAQSSKPQIHTGQLTPVHDSTPGVVHVNCPTPDAVKIAFYPDVDRTGITDHSLQVLREICSRACISSVAISSGQRKAETQARAMYQNVQKKRFGKPASSLRARREVGAGCL